MFCTPFLHRAEDQALEHGSCITANPRFLAESQLAFPQFYFPLSHLFPLPPKTLKTFMKKICEVLSLSQEANFHCIISVSDRNFSTVTVRKLMGKLPNAKIHRPRIVSLPDIIPLRIRWRMSTSFIKTDANKE